MLEIAGILTFLGLLVYIGARVVRAVEGAIEVLGVGVAAMGGYLFAELLSGLVHWAGDTLGTEHSPFVGKNFVLPFRLHHTDPKLITRHDFIETNGNNCLASLPLLVAMAVFLPARPGFWFYGCLLVAFAAWFVFCTNQFHKWAHADSPPRFARVLQRWGIILSPEHHAIHHAAPHDKYYCITVGWLNPLLTKTRFFRALEWLVGLVRPSLLHIEERTRRRSTGAP